MQSRRPRTAQNGDRRAGLALVAALLVACSSAATTPPLGALADHAPRPSKAPAPPASAAAASTEPPSPPWELATQLRRLHPALPRAPSEHFTGQLDGEILADDATAYPALGRARPVDPGTTLVQRLFTRGAPEPVAYLAMVKRPPGYDPIGSDWEYLVIDAAGRTEARGRLALCARCHADAPHDHLFAAAR